MQTAKLQTLLQLMSEGTLAAPHLSFQFCSRHVISDSTNCHQCEIPGMPQKPLWSSVGEVETEQHLQPILLGYSFN